MELTGRVIEVSSGTAYKDGIPRITVKITEAADWSCRVVLPNTDRLALDDEVHVQLAVRRASSRKAGA